MGARLALDRQHRFDAHRFEAMVSDKILCLAALLPTAAVVASGTFTALSAPTYRIADRFDGELRYADGERAVLKTPTGLRLVTVGSVVPSEGHVEAIVKTDGRWTVRTSAGILFVEK
jgi:hypothetical protein